VCTTARC